MDTSWICAEHDECKRLERSERVCCRNASLSPQILQDEYRSDALHGVRSWCALYTTTGASADLMHSCLLLSFLIKAVSIFFMSMPISVVTSHECWQSRILEKLFKHKCFLVSDCTHFAVTPLQFACFLPYSIKLLYRFLIQWQ